MVVAETSGSTTTSYLRGLGLVAQSDGTTTKYVLTDGLGSVRQVMDNAAILTNGPNLRSLWQSVCL